MAVNLQIDQPLSATATPVKDEGGATSVLSLSAGAIGIGTTTPQALVEVAGDVRLEKNGSPRLAIRSRGNGTQHYSIRATNDRDPAGGRAFIIRNEDHKRDEVVLDNRGNVTFSGDVRLSGADCAEVFPAAAGGALEAGTVVIMGDTEALRPCTEAYDRRVVGVVSGAGGLGPAIILGDSPDGDNRLPVALTGTVYCKVDAAFAPIGIGDPLTTSPSEGHAMKASDPPRSIGAVIGKALRGVSDGRAMIPILVALT